MSEATRRFFDFLHENVDNPRLAEKYELFISMASAMHRAEECGFVLDPDSVTEACRLALWEA